MEKISNYTIYMYENVIMKKKEKYVNLKRNDIEEWAKKNPFLFFFFKIIEK
jgi:hypothetical protein